MPIFTVGINEAVKPRSRDMKLTNKTREFIPHSIVRSLSILSSSWNYFRFHIRENFNPSAFVAAPAPTASRSLISSCDHISPAGVISAQLQKILLYLTPRPACFGGVLDAVSVLVT